MSMNFDSVKWNAHARVDKFTAEQEAEALRLIELEGSTLDVGTFLKGRYSPYETVESDGNLLTRLGLHRIWDRFIGTASNQALDATHTRIGVGNSATAAATTDTDLGAAAGSANRWFQLVGGVGTIGAGASSGILTVVATFGTADGNFAWAEWGIDGGTASGNTVTADANTTPGLINHKITSLGTKTSAASWVFTVTITIT